MYNLAHVFHGYNLAIFLKILLFYRFGLYNIR